MRQQVYCSFCKVPRKVYSNRHISLLSVLVLAVVSACFTFLVWRDFHALGLLVFVLLSFWLEFFTRYRWRQSIKCKACGFDPMIYKKSPEEAARTVKAFLEHRKEDPQYLLKPQPRITPIIKRQSQKKSHSRSEKA